MECTSVYSVPVLYVHIVETRLVWMSGGRIWPGGMRPANTENLARENEFARMIQINSDTHGLTICAYPSVSNSYKYLVPISYSITNPVAYLRNATKVIRELIYPISTVVSLKHLLKSDYKTIQYL